MCLPWCVPWILYSSAFKAEPWMQFKEAAVKDISNTGDVKVGAKVILYDVAVIRWLLLFLIWKKSHFYGLLIL